MSHLMHVIESAGGGSLQYVIDVTNLLSDRFKISIVHGTRSDTPKNLKELVPPEVELIPVRMKREVSPIADAQAVVDLARIMRDKRPDIVHLHSSKAGALGRIAARLAAIEKVVYTPHSFAFLREDVPSWKRSVFRAMEQVGAHLRGEFIACGKTEAVLARKLKPSVKVHLVENAILSSGEIAPRNVRSTHPPTVVGVGRLSAQKDPLRFVAIAHSVAKLFPNVRFQWVGDGELRSKVEQRAVELGVPLEILGWVTRAEVIRIMSNADLLLQTSRWEGASLVVLDALAAGLPIVASSIAGNADLIDHGETGLLCTHDEEFVGGISNLLRDGSRWQAMHQACKYVASTRFSRERFLADLVRAYGVAEGSATCE